MLISLQTQVDVLIYSIIAGIVLGALFDSYRLLRGFSNPNRILTFFEDMLFWIFSSIAIFIFLLYTNYAFMEIYVYIYMYLGVFCYIKFISKFYIYMQYNLIKYITKTLRVLKNFFLYPVQLGINYFITKIKIINNKK